jgi:putative restriction endonuclease
MSDEGRRQVVYPSGSVDSTTDGLIRMAAFTWLADLRHSYGDVVPFSELQKGFLFRNSRVRVLGPQGIFIPQGGSVPLSITTAPPKPGKDRPYDDEIGDDHLLRYKYRGDDINHRENVGLRRAMAENLPLIYFWGIAVGQYFPVWPAFVAADDPASLTFTIDFDAEQILGGQKLIESGNEARRAYVTQERLIRVHQAQFRQRVLVAYHSSCAICRLRYTELLDAAHILPDGHPLGEPIVPNGLALCKIHHAAFDRNILGIRPDLQIEVRSDILEEVDGPMLRYGLQACNKQQLLSPQRPEDKPHSDFLEERFQEFREAG